MDPFRLTDVESGEVAGPYSAAENSGIPITLPSRFSARVLLIDPA